MVPFLFINESNYLQLFRRYASLCACSYESLSLIVCFSLWHACVWIKKLRNICAFSFWTWAGQRKLLAVNMRSGQKPANSSSCSGTAECFPRPAFRHVIKERHWVRRKRNNIYTRRFCEPVVSGVCAHQRRPTRPPELSRAIPNRVRRTTLLLLSFILNTVYKTLLLSLFTLEKTLYDI